MNFFKKLISKHPIYPFTEEEKQTKGGNGFTHRGVSYIHHSQLQPKDTAFQRLTGFQTVAFIEFVLLIILLLLLNWYATVIGIIALLTILYFCDLLFNLYLIYRSFSKPLEINIQEQEIDQTRDWPMYTVLCPLYKEWQVLPQFIQSMQNLDYPKDKLQIMILLEEDDLETQERANAHNLPAYFDVVIVPHSKPKTKPKACNYGLQYAKGEYIVIYDAEDVPDPLQLKKAVVAFEKVGEKIVCIQAKLNFYNPHQNLLAKIFTAEYSLWFELILTGLHSINAPIPLGGTSNHFRTYDLKHKLKGWDSFNVTEDCDLGMRLVKSGYRTAIMNSLTLEEANSSPRNWFAQRTRWIKGYIQTYLVHTRRPHEFIKDWKEPHFLTFQLVVGGKILSMFINPIMWTITICYFLFRAHIGTFIEAFFPAPILYMGVFSLIFGNFLYLYYYMIGCMKHGHYELIKYVCLVPFYWLAISIASWVALYRLIVSPHYWSKTKHGLHLNTNKKTSVIKREKTISDNTFTIESLITTNN